MTPTLNHLALSRAQLAQASELAKTGRTALARTHLLFAADHALLALALRSALELPRPEQAPDPVAIAVRLADIGAAPAQVATGLRDLHDDSFDCMHDPALTARLTDGFDVVQELIDANLAHPASPPPPRPAMPSYGGAHGALDARGAEAAARGLRRIGTAMRATLHRR